MLLFVADDINNKRKGFNILLKAFNNIRQKDNIIICTVGSNANVSRDDNIYNLGKIYDERLLSMAYSAADILINPAIEEAFGNTIIESSMCGTPVVGFAVGGLNDTIIQNHNGRLCKEISVDALKEEIEYTMDNINTFNREEIRKETEKKYSLRIQANKYMDIYNSI